MSTPATHSWAPSAARVLTITGFTPRPRGAGFTTLASALGTAPAWPTKDPADVLDYIYDIGPAIWGDDGDSIAFLDVTIMPDAAGDLVLSSSSTNGQIAILWLGGGQSGTIYTITLTLGTLAGRSFQRSVSLPVLSLSSEPAAGADLVTDAGTPITDQAGNPITIEG